jgi:serine/threonine-protein kinase
MPDQDSSRDYDLLDRLVEEFNERFRCGERLSVKEYCDRHPELADDLRELLPALAQVEQAKGGLDEPPAPAPASLPSVADFRILREIGHGGMGVVYEAEQISLGRRVALKVLTDRLMRDERQRRRFEREARAAARLHHTNIVPVFGTGDAEGVPYYAMQFIQGMGLDKVVEELARIGSAAAPPTGKSGLTVSAASAGVMARSLITGEFPGDGLDELNATQARESGARAATPPSTLPSDRAGEQSGSSVTLPGQELTASGGKLRKLTFWQSVARVGAQVADALDYAHKQGVVHRDVKPSNLLLDLNGTVWVTDFGLAKAEGADNLTHTGDVLGTLRYMPPEAFDGQADTRGDIYSLGLTLYELTALRPAFGEKERNRLIKQVTTAEVEPLRRARRGVPRDLETIVHKAIDRDPARRYPSAGELRDDLLRFIDDEPIRARRQSLAEKAVRWARHHPGIAALAVVLAVVLVLVTAGSLVVAGRMSALATREAQAAEDERVAHREAEKAREEAEAAQVKEKHARQDADTARAKAEANFVKAFNAVDEYRKAGQEMVKVTGLAPVGKELLRSALAFYQDYLRDRGNDPTAGTALATAYSRVGAIHAALGDTAAAKRAYAEALRRFQQATRDRSDDVEALAGQAECLGRIGKTDEALALLVKLVQPADPRFQAQLATAYNSKAIALKAAKDVEGALRAHQRALEVRKRLITLDPDNAKYRRDLGATLNNIGVLVGDQRRHDLALQMYRRAAAHVRVAYEKSPNDLLSGRFYVITLSNVSRVERDLGQADQGLPSLKQAVAVARKITADFYAVPDAHALLYRYSLALGRRQQAAGDHAGARQSLYLARSALARLSRDTPADLVLLAQAHALAATALAAGRADLTEEEKAEQRQERDRAMDALHRAVAAGYLKPDVLRKSADLRGLRSRRDFWTLVNSLQAKVDAAAAREAKLAALKKAIKEAEGLARAGGSGAEKQLQAQERLVALRQEMAGLARPGGADLTADLATSRHAAGVLQLGLGRLEDAAESLRQARQMRELLVKKDPKNIQHRADFAASLLAQGDLHRRTGRLREANQSWTDGIGMLRQAAEEAGKDEALAVRLAAAEQERGLWLAGQALWEEALDHVNRAHAATPITEPWVWRVKALLYLKVGDGEGYRRCCREIEARFGKQVARSKGSGSAHQVAAAWSVSAGGADPERSVELAAGFAQAKPDESWRRFYQALACYRAELLDEAHALLNLACHQATPLKALLAHRRGDIAEARRWLARTDERYEKAVRQSFDDPDAAFGVVVSNNILTDVLQFLLLRREAHQVIDGQAPTDPAERIYQAVQYARLGLTRKADASIEAAVAARPADVNGWLLRGQAFAVIGRDDLAREDFAAAKGKGTDPAPWIAHGQFLAGRGRHREADEAFVRAAELAPDELHRFIQAGWWVVGDYPADLRLPAPPETFADPSRLATSFDGRPGLRWRHVLPDEEGRAHLGPSPTPGSATRTGYALTYLYSAKEQPALLKIGGGDRARYWLNGRLVHEVHEPNVHTWTLGPVPVTLRAGRNTLLAEVLDTKKKQYSLMVCAEDHPLHRASTLAQLGLWKEAVAASAPLCDGDLSALLEAWTADTWAFHSLWCLAAGDLDRFRRFREQARRLWGAETMRWRTNVVALALAAEPGTKVDADELLRLAEPAEKSHWWRPTVQALALVRIGRPEKAVELITRSNGLVNPPPEASAPWAVLALAYHHAGKAGEARRWLDKLDAWYAGLVKKPAADAGPVVHFWASHLAFNLIYYREAKKVIDGKDLLDDPAWKAVQDHNRKWLKGRDPTLAPYDQAVALSPALPGPWLARGRRLAELKRDREAEADFARAVAARPEDPLVWKRRGEVRAELGLHDGAAADFVKALELAKAGHGAIHDALLPFEEAYRRVARLRPEDRELREARAHHFARWGRWAEAEREMREVLALKPKDPVPWCHAAVLALAAGEPGRCREAARACLELIAPGDHEQRFHAGVLLLLATPIKDPELLVKAAGMVRAAAAKGPSNIWYAHGQVLAAMRLGRLAEARRLLEKAQALPRFALSEPQGLLLTALVEQGLGRTDEARKALAEARASLKRLGHEPGRWTAPESNWHVLVNGELLLREAGAVIEGKKGDPEKK